MIILISIISVVALAVAAYYVVNFLDKDVPTTDNDVPTYTQQELDNIELAEELYNKDLRPVVAKKAKTKPAPELEVVEPEFVEKVVEIAKVFPPDATINAEAVVEKVKESKPEFPIDKPKKKRKYYPKTKK
jgi:hypothetical protein